jgi:hypothetical protein
MPRERTTMPTIKIATKRRHFKALLRMASARVGVRGSSIVGDGEGPDCGAVAEGLDVGPEVAMGEAAGDLAVPFPRIFKRQPKKIRIPAPKYARTEMCPPPSLAIRRRKPRMIPRTKKIQPRIRMLLLPFP